MPPCLSLLVAALWMLAPAAAHAQQSETFRGAIEASLDAIDRRAAEDLGDDAASRALAADAEEIVRQLGRWGGRRDGDLAVRAAETHRLLRLVSAAPAAERAGWHAWLRERDDLARTLAFAMTDADPPAGMVRTLGRLREAHGDATVAAYPSLVAALCVVHDGPRLHAVRINENRAESAGPVPLFGYFTTNERRLLFGLRDVPPELLVFVVDATGSVDELAWALERHGGDRSVGTRFFDIEYDYAHMRTGQPKRVTVEGFTLPNIQRCGGVCADQAYYAATVGKAIGVPTAYVTGRGGEEGHAWVGYLEARGRSAAWNFDVGRYREYQGVQGTLLDPQSGRRIGDDELALLGRLAQIRAPHRHEAAAWLDAAAALERSSTPSERSWPERGRQREPRAGRAGLLELAELGLRRNPGDRRGWALVRRAVADADMPMRDRVAWSQTIMRLCEQAGAEHFMVSLLQPMITSMPGGRERSGVWERVLDSVKTKKDLRARIRMIQARDALGRGDRHAAFLAYQDVYRSYLNDTRESQNAVFAAVSMLEKAGKHQDAAQLLEDVLARVERPISASTFSSHSNYARIRAFAAEYAQRHRVPIAGAG
ncbi:MAG: hypothetical protein AAFX79_00810 [Planctomycetota bacterium]